jgi:signal transduction histidine kinase
MSFKLRSPWTLKSVPARLTFWYLCTLGASLAAFAVFVFLVRASTLYRELDAKLEVQAHQLAAELRPALLALDVGEALAAQPRAREAMLLVRELPDHVVYRSPGWPPLDWRAERRLAEAVRAATPLVTVDDRGHVAWRAATVVVPRPGVGPVAVQVLASTEPLQQSLGRLAGLMLGAILAVLAVASYGSTATARRALAPIDEIVARVREIQARGSLERLDVEPGSDELDRLVVTLNEMLDRIAASVASARRFAADASHELQTPLAAMRAIVEMCLRADRDAASYRAMAEDLLTEIERLSALVRDLRLLALAEAGHLLTDLEPVDLATLAEECCEIARAVAEDQQIALLVEVDARPLVQGSALHLRRVLLNLTDNAIRYSPPGGWVRVHLTTADGRARLSVEDRGCGIAPADLPRIFEPFYRADPARARATGGSGLGLAIADQVVRAHGGRIEVTSTLGVGSTFTVDLPLARPS